VPLQCPCKETDSPDGVPSQGEQSYGCFASQLSWEFARHVADVRSQRTSCGLPPVRSEAWGTERREAERGSSIFNCQLNSVSNKKMI
jgi:hypothetical protein